MSEHYQKIVSELQHKVAVKQEVYRQTYDVFKSMKQVIAECSRSLGDDIAAVKEKVEVSYKENGEFEIHLKFGGDTLIFIMHTNVFSFPQEHFVHKTDYVKKDKLNAYCGMLMVYNFLSDTVKYNRVNDTGYLIARIFINREGSFFVQGKRQFSYKFKEFGEGTITEEDIRTIIETSVLHAIEFDLVVPNFEMAQEITLMQKMQDTGLLAIKTGKQLGFSVTGSSNQED